MVISYGYDDIEMENATKEHLCQKPILMAPPTHQCNAKYIARYPRSRALLKATGLKKSSIGDNQYLDYL